MVHTENGHVLYGFFAINLVVKWIVDVEITQASVNVSVEATSSSSGFSLINYTKSDISYYLAFNIFYTLGWGIDSRQRIGYPRAHFGFQNASLKRLKFPIQGQEEEHL